MVIRLETKNTISEYRNYHQVKMININILQEKKRYLLIKVKW